MHLSRLTVQGLRNLSDQTLPLSAGINVFHGANASGKSSILEALHILGTGRSFRSRRFQDIIQYKKKSCLVAGILEDDNVKIPLGYQRQGSQVELHVNREKVSKASHLAQQFPLRIIHPESDELISGSPSNRRRFIDWGVFHVEHGFHKVWQNYNTVLKQRNAAIKSRLADSQIKLWDKQLAESGSELHQYRSTYLDVLLTNTQNLKGELFPDAELEVDYQPGWDIKEDLQLVLDKNLDRDKKQGFTSAGPHRADIRFFTDKHQATEFLSRGQLKNLVVLMTLAQIKTYSQQTNKPCALLFDDFASELDADRRETVFSTLSKLNTQLFITCIDVNSLSLSETSENTKLFHVEQGVITNQ